MPDWQNVAWGIFILMAFVYAFYSFERKNYDNSLGWANFKDFIMPIFSLMGYGFHLLILTFFTSADLATMIMLTLLFLAIILIVVSILAKSEKTKSNFKDIAFAVAGLALGIPFGEKIRKAEIKVKTKKNKENNNHGKS